ncbi:type II toxin-antitoxin system Phd/YefM family antitoxin [Thiohalorhabdus sp.]|uniref:type II toxin-antitoxin system Phd/YefM family antitoxin n=1 Tax=Thiohalorhabdus sp. TaxID=3094134 RepID=UPI002FC3CEE3
MEIINIHEAKTRLSQLLEEVQRGKPFIIAKAGKPIARVTSMEAPEPDRAKRVGFLAGQIEVPEDFDRMGEEAILAMFGEDDAPPP